MTERRQGHRWQPITDLPEALACAKFPELDGLLGVFRRRRDDLDAAKAIDAYTRRLVRSWSIETGILENLYTLGEGVTMSLVEHGFDAALISHGDTNLPAGRLVEILRDHQEAAEGLFAFVNGKRVLGTSCIKELHRVLTRHQEASDAVDQFGNWVRVPLLRGEWKKQPNNPGDATTGVTRHQYCPPEHTASEMDRLIAMHEQHAHVHPVIEAAWLHHRFTQVHPFQDGNGRVARALASLVCIRGGGFPIVVMRQQKTDYIRALEAGDEGDLGALVKMFETQQRAALLRAVAHAEEVIEAPATVAAAIADAKRRIGAFSDGVPERVQSLTTELCGLARVRLEEVAADLRAALAGKVATEVRADFGGAPSMIPILGVALRRGHGVNVGGTVLAVDLRMVNGGSTRITLAFVPMGPATLGLMAAVAFFVGLPDPLRVDGGASVEPLYDAPFTLTGDRAIDELKPGFAAWLEPVLARGIELWQRGA